MTSSPPAENQPKDHATPAATAPDFAASMHAFWEKNRGSIYILCAAVLLGIVGREGWQYFSAMRERGIEAEYAKVAGASDQLAAFAASHPGHSLAGVALLRLADEKYTAGDFKTAAAHYAKAAEALGNDALKARARLGGAMSQLGAGDQAAGEAALKALSADAALVKTVRAEATYHLALLAKEAGKTDELKKLVEEVSKIDATSAWAQRAFVLRATLDEGKEPEAGNAITFKPGGE
jgi:predicted negative regulator of RcsB-dependent stress response